MHRYVVHVVVVLEQKRCTGLCWVGWFHTGYYRYVLGKYAETIWGCLNIRSTVREGETHSDFTAFWECGKAVVQGLVPLGLSSGQQGIGAGLSKRVICSLRTAGWGGGVH
jgi:hypothetical protein